MLPLRWINHATSRRALESLFACLLLTTTGCASATLPSDSSNSVNACHTRVVIAFAQNPGERPADDLVMEISRASNVALVFVRAAGPGLYVFQLDANDADDSCSAALARLRGDARVRSVDLDERRHVLG